ncbi:HD domain-containing protein [Actinocorallia herbida]
MFTDHGLAHAEALWDIGSLICGDAVEFNPAEAFVLGCAFLLHDLGMALASYPDGEENLAADPRFPDLVAEASARIRTADQSADDGFVQDSARKEAVSELLRLRHAEQAETIVREPFAGPKDESIHLLQDPELRRFFGALIGRIAHSHWWPVSRLADEFNRKLGACPFLPGKWEVDQLKIACLLRLADAAHIDERRAPLYLHAFRRPTGVSAEHWKFQSMLTRPLIDDDRMLFTSPSSFTRADAEAWWLAFETIQLINEEFRQVDALLADLRLPRFAVRSVAGAESPERLSQYLPCDRWSPIDASLRVSDAIQVIAKIGGTDMYGQRPDVALRELIANASDATLMLTSYEDVPAKPVTVTLEQHDGDWWLEVHDRGIGMSASRMVAALTDFGQSHWRSSATTRDYPGLSGSGFRPTGRFGIGFFAVFMVADEVHVSSRVHEEASSSTHVLEFRNGVRGRPLLRKAEPLERLRESGTKVRLKLRDDPRSTKGIFRTDSPLRTHNERLHALVEKMCALSEVDIAVQGPDDPSPTIVIRGRDWEDLPAEDLFRRLYWKGTERYVERSVYERYAKLFAAHETRIYDDAGRLSGRAMTAPSGGITVHWNHGYEKAQLYVGGLHSSDLAYVTGALTAEPTTAARFTAFPSCGVTNLQKWIEVQVENGVDQGWANTSELWNIADIAAGFGATSENLPCALNAERSFDLAAFRAVAEGLDEVMLIALGGMWIFSYGDGFRFFSYNGGEVTLPPAAFISSFYPSWIFPEEIHPRPTYEPFAEKIRRSPDFEPFTWWYERAHYGPIGLLISALADIWGTDLDGLFEGVEVFSQTTEADQRLVLESHEGEGVALEALRFHRPKEECA